MGWATHGGCPLGAPSSAGGLPGIGCGLPLEVLMVRENDTGSLGAGGGLFGECGDWFYGTMAGPGWYHGTARAARGCQVPFSVLRMLIQATPERMQKVE